MTPRIQPKAACAEELPNRVVCSGAFFQFSNPQRLGFRQFNSVSNGPFNLDVESNAPVPAATGANDGLLISPHLLNTRGPALVTGAPGVGVINASFSQIEKYLAGLLPP